LVDADILLLDEPTNFLDVKHIDWLARFLQSYPKAYIVVSHLEAFFIRDCKYGIRTRKWTDYTL
jgi:ATPase subunit of ABC transporter with duplicated ATPase domains